MVIKGSWHFVLRKMALLKLGLDLMEQFPD